MFLKYLFIFSWSLVLCIYVYVFFHIIGYVARRIRKFTSCKGCNKALIAENSEINESSQDFYKFIASKSRGYLVYPTNKLVQIIVHLEKIVLKCVKEEQCHQDLLMHIMREISLGPQIPLIGCDAHKSSLTERILQFFLITRMHFFCKQLNKNENNTNKTKKIRKHSKF